MFFAFFTLLYIIMHEILYLLLLLFLFFFEYILYKWSFAFW